MGASLEKEMQLLRVRNIASRLLVAVTCACVLYSVACAEDPPLGPQELYEKSEVMIPMRDGTKLYTEVYKPKHQNSATPIILLRTPYGVADAQGGFTRYFRSTFRELHKDRYVFAIQDARGRHKSEGEFEWNRPVRHRTDPDAIDASTDAFDTIEWLTTNVENNGRVGMLGVSYPGWYVTMALIDPHPALKAASPQASPSDYFVGDDFYHFGAFRLSPSAELPYLFDFDPRKNSRFPYDQIDTYEFFLDLGPLANMNRDYLHDRSPTWNHFVRHDTYDEYWQRGGTLQHLTSLEVPTLNVVGWWDAENLGGALDIYDQLESTDGHANSWLVVGPWSHGQWARGPGESLGQYHFGSDQTAFYQQEIEAPFFKSLLWQNEDIERPEATLFQTGSNKWKTYQSWPPDAANAERWYLSSLGGLATDSPAAGAGYREFVSDPENPVPYSKRPIMGFWQGLAGSQDPRFGRAGKLWKVEDQRFVQGRPDVLSFVSEPLEEGVEIAGHIEACLSASTSGTDCDWVVKLIDVYPENYPSHPELGGYQLMIADDVIRAKFRDSLSTPTPLTPNVPEQITIDLRTRNHLFRKGHRIMVQVQSSWFPLIDRNPQKFMRIPTATESDFQAANQRVYCERDRTSFISLPVVRK
ncbi:MAG TPA: X-Pro dipeptidyl-peptidase [Planctomycetaceae bacterium]|nr:X-Pro dipeptidyl-peptidase [Planctomycetaceae bacterium]